MTHFGPVNLQPMTYANPRYSHSCPQNCVCLESPQVKLIFLCTTGPGVIISIYTASASKLPSHCLCSLCPHGPIAADDPQGKGVAPRFCSKCHFSDIFLITKIGEFHRRLFQEKWLGGYSFLFLRVCSFTQMGFSESQVIGVRSVWHFVAALGEIPQILSIRL